MKIKTLFKQYYGTIEQLEKRRSLLKEKLKQSNQADTCKELEKRISVLSEEIYELKDIIGFLENRYGGDSLYDKNI